MSVVRIGTRTRGLKQNLVPFVPSVKVISSFEYKVIGLRLIYGHNDNLDAKCTERPDRVIGRQIPAANRRQLPIPNRQRSGHLPVGRSCQAPPSGDIRAGLRVAARGRRFWTNKQHHCDTINNNTGSGGSWQPKSRKPRRENYYL